MASKQLSTRQLLDKIPNFPSLYRHSVSGIYYGIKKLSGKRKEHSLDTPDRKTAERKLKQWIENLDKIDAKAQRTPLSELLEKFEKVNQGKADKTKATNASIIKVFKETWKHGLDIRIPDIKPSHLNEWLAQHESRLKNTTYNRYVTFLKQLFEIAVNDRVIAESPVLGVKTKWKKPQKPIRNVPTLDQLAAIVKDIREQKFNGDGEESADFIDFIGAAGLGQAEVSSLELDDVDWDKNRIRIRRQKTDKVFYVPIYKHLKPLLEKRCNLAKEAKRKKLFTILDAKKALSAACKRLEFKNFSQRNIRQVLIRRLWQSGVDYKLISKWQGHQDGGKLILDTYTEVFGDNDESYEKQQLAKIV